MNNLLKVTIIIFGFSFVGSSGFADENFSESAMLLQQALMDSNGDYNKLKKNENYEEFDRADKWNDRNLGAITINQRGLSNQEYKEFQRLQDELNPSDREISSQPKDFENESYNN